MRAVIYAITFPDGSCYVGSTVNFSARRRQHLGAIHKDKHTTNRLLTAKLRQFGICCIFQVAAALDADKVHLVEADVIAALRPDLNVVVEPTPVYRAPAGASTNSRPFGPYPSINAAAKALGTNRTRLRKAGSYEAFVQPKPYRPREKYGPPDPRKNGNHAFVDGGWYRREDLRAQHGMGRKALNRRIREGAPLSARPERAAPLTRVCRRYGVSKHYYRAARTRGATIRQALGLDPTPPGRRPKVKKRMLTAAGTTMPLDAWAKKIGVRPGVIHSRLGLGWTVEQAVGVEPSPAKLKVAARAAAKAARPPRGRQAKQHTVRGVTGTVEDLCKVFDAPVARVGSRVDRGWTLEEALIIGKLPPNWNIDFARAQPYYQRLMAPSPTSCTSNALDISSQR